MMDEVRRMGCVLGGACKRRAGSVLICSVCTEWSPLLLVHGSRTSSIMPGRIMNAAKTGLYISTTRPPCSAVAFLRAHYIFPPSHACRGQKSPWTGVPPITIVEPQLVRFSVPAYRDLTGDAAKTYRETRSTSKLACGYDSSSASRMERPALLPCPGRQGRSHEDWPVLYIAVRTPGIVDSHGERLRIGLGNLPDPFGGLYSPVVDEKA